MPDFSYEIIRLDPMSIDLSDEMFRISLDCDHTDLKSSIDSFGLISHPIVLHQNINQFKSYRIVCGFKRIAACLSLGFPTVDVKSLRFNDVDEKSIHLTCIQLSIEDCVFQRKLNIVEQASVVGKLFVLIGTQSQWQDTASSILKIQQNPLYIEKLLRIDKLPLPVKQWVVQERISFNTAIALSELESELSIQLADLFAELMLSVNKQNELLTLIKEIAIRDGCTIQNVLEHGEMKTIMDNPDQNRNERTQSIRHYLKKRRFPEISKHIEAFDHILKTIKLSSKIKITPPEYFEGNTYMMQIQFRNWNELVNHKDTIERILSHNDFKKWFER
ncbi:MAG: hypothetical protein HQK77_05780 [Desulfobacterales bacterium]|nr:hypothetical protein [Desulfobacterales bacterium]